MTHASTRPFDIYARQSPTAKQQKNNETKSREPSLEGQVAVCRGRLDELGLEVGEVLVDPQRSAWKVGVERPAWDELVRRAKNGESGGFIVFDLERYTRQPPDAETMIELAVDGFMVLDSESEYDLTTPNGKKSFRDAINAAAYYSDRLSTRVRRGKKLKAMTGEPNGSGRPFGFEEDRVTQREDEVAILRDLTQRLLSGEPQKSLIDDLNARQITTATGRPWEAVSLRHVLTRQRNCGKIIYTDPKTKKESVVGTLPGDPIIPEEDLERVISIYTARRRGRPNSPAYVCSGIAVCGECGRKLAGRPVAALKPYPDGSVRRQYWCRTRAKDGGCPGLYADQRALDEAAKLLTVEILSDERHINAVEAMSHEVNSEAARLDLEIAAAEKTAEELSGRLGRGEILLTRYDLAIKPLDQRIARLTAERKALGNTNERRPKRASKAYWLRRWTDADSEGKRDLLKMALRGRRLVVARNEPGTQAHAPDVTDRVTVED